MANHVEAQRRIRDNLFWSLTDRSSGCWEWIARRDRHGYGIIQRFHKRMMAHRHAYELSRGAIPEGLIVRHACDNPPCINPDHLLLGTPADNSRDAVERGRNFRPIGELHPRTHLTEDQVREIRETYDPSRQDGAAFAARYGVSRPTICNIVARRSWKHLDAVDPEIASRQLP